MRRHVIIPFRGVSVLRVTVRRHPIQKCVQIGQHIRVGVLLNHQRSRSVPDEHREQSRGHPLSVRPGDDFMIDVVQSSPIGFDGYLVRRLFRASPFSKFIRHILGMRPKSSHLP